MLRPDLYEQLIVEMDFSTKPGYVFVQDPGPGQAIQVQVCAHCAKHLKLTHLRYFTEVTHES